MEKGTRELLIRALIPCLEVTVCLVFFCFSSVASKKFCFACGSLTRFHPRGYRNRTQNQSKPYSRPNPNRTWKQLKLYAICTRTRVCFRSFSVGLTRNNSLKIDTFPLSNCMRNRTRTAADWNSGDWRHAAIDFGADPASTAPNNACIASSPNQLMLQPNHSIFFICQGKLSHLWIGQICCQDRAQGVWT